MSELLKNFTKDGFAVIPIDNLDSNYDKELQSSLDSRYSDSGSHTSPNFGYDLVTSLPELDEVFDHKYLRDALGVLLGDDYVRGVDKWNLMQRRKPGSHIFSNDDFHRETLSYNRFKHSPTFDNRYIHHWGSKDHTRKIYAFYSPSEPAGISVISGSYTWDDLFDYELHEKPFKWDGKSSVFLMHSQMFHKANIWNYLNSNRHNIRFTFDRLTEPEMVDFYIANNNYHYSWYHGDKSDSDECTITAKDLNSLKSIKSQKGRSELLYSLAGFNNPDIITNELVNLPYGDFTDPYCYNLGKLLALSMEGEDLLCELIDDTSKFWSCRVHLLDALGDRGVGDADMQKRWIEWMSTQTSINLLTTLSYWASIVCQGNREMFDLLCEKVEQVKNVIFMKNSLYSIYRMAKRNSWEVSFSFDSPLIRKYQDSYWRIYDIIKWMKKELDIQ